MKIIIIGKLDGLNEYTRECRGNKYGGNTCKRVNEFMVIQAIYKAKLKRVTKYPIKLKITWYERNLRRDIDNICFAVKFILDALVKCAIIENDSQKYVNGIEHIVKVDKDNPRIEVEILEG